MTPKATALANILLDIHREKCRGQDFTGGISKEMVKERTITYKNLCEQARVRFARNVPGPLLNEIAKWCEQHRVPPLHALAVTRHTGKPGYNYNGAPGGCSLAKWPEQVRKCIAYEKYPPLD
jgi:hypothetical protein